MTGNTALDTMPAGTMTGRWLGSSAQSRAIV